jgi:serine/threonine-protein kinase RsbW
MPADFASSAQDSPLSELLNLVIQADAEAINTAVDTISETLGQLNIPEQKRMEIGLAVQEALANAVVHGCKNDPSKQVRCQMESDSQGRILIVVTDPGPGFDPGHVSNPKHHEKLYGDHGRGVYLIRELMDEVQFGRSGNEVRMWKY